MHRLPPATMAAQHFVRFTNPAVGIRRQTHAARRRHKEIAMASKVRGQFKVTAQDGTTVTLQPVAGDKTKGDLADNITQIVLTMGARDTRFFDIVNRVFEIDLLKK